MTPHKSALIKIGAKNYKIEEALAELVDNSIDAQTNEGVTIKVNIEQNKITVADDGTGMNFEQAKKACVMFLSEKKDQLGEFGIGLKAATMSMGNAFSYKTTAQDNNQLYTFQDFLFHRSIC